MKTKNILLLVLAVALSGTASQAFAEETTTTPSSYVVLKGGMYSPSMSFDLDNFNAGNTEHFDSKTGFAGELAIGHYFLPILALELGGGYFESRGHPATVPGETKLRVMPLIATGKVFLPLGPFEPYGLAGIGAYITDLEVNGSSSNFDGSTEVTYGFHAGAGFNINFSRNMFAGLEGKYIWAEPSFGGQHLPLDGFIATANIGLRF